MYNDFTNLCIIITDFLQDVAAVPRNLLFIRIFSIELINIMLTTDKKHHRWQAVAVDISQVKNISDTHDGIVGCVVIPPK
jgi:hypothetical protein